MKKTREIKQLLTVCLIGLLLCGCGEPEEMPVSIEQTSSFEAAVSSEAAMSEEVATLTEAEAAPTADATSTEETTPAEDVTSSEIEPPRLTLIMVGDILLHTPVEESALQEDGTYRFDAIFANLEEEIQGADLAIVNQEIILGGEELGVSGYPAFNAPYEVGDALVDVGFDVVCHGTNHALDKGKKGLLNCLSYWEENHPQIGVLGIHDSAEEQNEIYIYEENGIRVALLNYTYGTNGIALPSDMPYAVDLLEEEKVRADLAKAEEMADFTIVCPHWGTEYLLGISAQQEKWAEIFVEGGADLILGTHPHVIEPIEWVADEESGNEALVYYSLGNFVNWTSGTGSGVANRMVGGMAQVTLEMDEQGDVTISEHGILPIVCHVESGDNGVTVYALEEYTGELAGQNEIINQDAAFSLEYCEQLCEEVWKNE